MESVTKNRCGHSVDGSKMPVFTLKDEMVRGLIFEVGLGSWDDFCVASNTSSHRLGLNTLGDIAPNYTTNMTAFDENFCVLFTVIGGKKTCR